VIHVCGVGSARPEGNCSLRFGESALKDPKVDEVDMFVAIGVGAVAVC